MRINRTSILLGGFLTSALVVAAGCSSDTSTPHPDSGATAGTTGAGGGAGGANADAGAGGAPIADGGAGHDGGAGAGVGGAPADGGAGRDGSVEVGDAGHDSSGPCTTSYGDGNPVQYAFNGGVNGGWYQFLGPDPSNTGVTTSLGASFTEGRSCPGALQLGVNFMVYGMPNAQAPSAATEIYFGDSPNGRNWTPYKALHAWIKVQTTDYLQLAGVYSYVKSAVVMPTTAHYQAAPLTTGADLSNGQFHEVVVDLTVLPSGPFTGVVANDIQLIGFQVLLNMAPPTGAPATPSQVILLVDDIWLEAKPPTDAGADAAADAPTGG